MAWDDDGTVLVYRRDNQSLSEVSSADKVNLNSEESTGPGLIADNYYMLFPELREFDGIFIHQAQPRAVEVLSSGDTTNGIDGSWTTQIANYDQSSKGQTSVYDDYRDEITSAAASNIRGIWLDGDFTNPAGDDNYWLHAIHVYGEIAAGETPDRLLWVDNSTGSEFGLPVDYGDIPRGSAEDTEVLLRNNSGSLTAASVQITGEALYLNSGSWYTFKESGGSFQSTLPLSSSIGAGSDSPVLTIRRITPDTETLGLHAGRAQASVGSWS